MCPHQGFSLNTLETSRRPPDHLQYFAYIFFLAIHLFIYTLMMVSMTKYQFPSILEKVLDVMGVGRSSKHTHLGLRQLLMLIVGLSLKSIMEAGRWKSKVFKSYIRCPLVRVNLQGPLTVPSVSWGCIYCTSVFALYKLCFISNDIDLCICI